MLSDARAIWYVHPYAGGPGVGRYDRPYHLARHWARLGTPSVILSPSFHHLLDVPRRPGIEEMEGVRYEFLRSPHYGGNGLGRVVNMAAFTAQLAYHGTDLARQHGRPAMIISSSPHPYAFLAVRHLARRFSAHSVFEVRDLWPLSLVELAGVPPSHPMVRMTGWLERYAYRHADSVVSLLPLARQHMLPLGLDERRWHYIPNGVEPQGWDLQTGMGDCAALARCWREAGRTVVVYAGALGRPNHVESLVRAVALLDAAGEVDVGVIIVGRGDLQVELRELVATLGLGGRVAIFDQIAKSAVQGLLREASAGYISLRPEPLFRFGVSPNKLFDYMLASLPVIFAVRAGNDPVVEAACGVSTDPGDPRAIARAIASIAAESEVRRREMGERGRTYVLERHGYDKLAQAYLDLLGPA